MPKLDKMNYHNFTIKERINLTIAALARDDNDEIARLRRTCQRKQYSMIDREYTSKLDNLTWIAAHLLELQNHHYNRILTIMLFIATHPNAEDSLDISYYDELVHIKSLYEAFYSFCNDIGLNKDHIVEWLRIDPRLIYEIFGEDALKIIRHDDEFFAQAKRQFLTIWNEDYSEFK